MKRGSRFWHIVVGCAIGIAACLCVPQSTLADVTACHASPPAAALRQVIEVPAPALDETDGLRHINQATQAALFGFAPEAAGLLFLPSHPSAGGTCFGWAASQHAFTLTIEAIATDEDPAGTPGLEVGMTAFCQSVALEISAFVGRVSTDLSAYWVSGIAMSMDASQGRQTIVYFTSADSLTDGTVSRVVHADAQGGGEIEPSAVGFGHSDGAYSNDETGSNSNPALCLAMKQACKNNYDATMDNCNALLVMALATFAICLVTVAWSAWGCLALGLGCPLLAWAWALCTKALVALMGAYALCVAQANIAYWLCMNRANAHPACEGLYEW